MKRMLTEQQVLKKMDIPDFRHVTKDKIITFASMLPNMDPEVAKKALEQFPDFAKTSLEVMKEYKAFFETVVEKGSEEVKSVNEMYNRVMDNLEKMLNKENLSFEEQKFILEQMKEVADKVDKKDTEHKNFLLKALAISGTVAAGIVVSLVSAIGSNILGGSGNGNNGFDI